MQEPRIGSLTRCLRSIEAQLKHFPERLCFRRGTHGVSSEVTGSLFECLQLSLKVFRAIRQITIRVAQSCIGPLHVLDRATHEPKTDSQLKHDEPRFDPREEGLCVLCDDHRIRNLRIQKAHRLRGRALQGDERA